MRDLKKKIYKLVEPPAEGESNDAFDIFIVVLIALNVLAVILHTVESLAARYEVYFNAFEVFSVAVFSIEYMARIGACTADKRYKGPIIGRVRFALTPMGLVDLFAILPFYLPLLLPLDLRFLRSLRLFRLFRILKIARYSQSLRTFAAVLEAKREQMIITIFSVLILLVFASSFMYYAENEAQPDRFSSIPASMWWGVATLTTVGYGDVYPITPLGKLFGAIISVLGIGMFALPAGILASGFSEHVDKNKERNDVCPHCGSNVDKRPGKSYTLSGHG